VSAYELAWFDPAEEAEARAEVACARGVTLECGQADGILEEQGTRSESSQVVAPNTPAVSFYSVAPGGHSRGCLATFHGLLPVRGLTIA
jgi:hypothetical protein